MRNRKSTTDTCRTAFEFTFEDIWILPFPKNRCVCRNSGTWRLNGRSPALTGVVFRHRGTLVGRLFAQIPLVNDAVLADDKGHDPCVSVFHWIRQDGESARHLSVYDVVFTATLCSRALLCKYPVVVAVEWLGLVARVGVAQCFCEVTKRAKGALRLAFCNGPVQTVLFALIAGK